MSNLLTLTDFKIHFKNQNRIICFNNFTISDDAFVIITGPNGCGKSTFFNLFLNEDISDTNNDIFMSGCVEFEDKLKKIDNLLKINSLEHASLRRRISFVSQNSEFINNTTAYDALLFPVKTAIEYEPFSSIEKIELLKNAIKLVDEYFEDIIKKNHIEIDFNKFKRRKVNTYSGGQKKIISIIAAMIKCKIMQSGLLILDEPTNNLDALNKMIVNNLFATLKEQQKICIIMITHCKVFYGVQKEMKMTRETCDIFDNTNFVDCLTSCSDNDNCNNKYTIK